MPIYEYECQKCGHISSFLENPKNRIKNWFSRKCFYCSSRKLKKIYSSFYSHSDISHNDMLNELKKTGNVQFVQKMPGYNYGPPPGGCPFKDEKSYSK